MAEPDSIVLENLVEVRTLLDDIKLAIVEIDRKVEAMADASQVSELGLKIDDLTARISSLN